MLKWPASYERLGREVALKDAIVVPSVNHTGTWFVLDFLAGHPGTGDVVELPSVLARNSLTPGSIVHFHVAGCPPLWDAYDGLRERMVIPLRDPLACLCTRQARHPFLDHRYIIDGFLRIAMDHEGAQFFPVDCDPIIRWDVLRRILAHAGLDHDDEYVEFWARTWKPRNSIGYDTAEKGWYRDDAWDALRESIGPEFDLLLESRPTLIPFLEEQGYKELPWWTL